MKTSLWYVLASSLALMVAAAAFARFGGFGVSAYLPSPSDPQTKDAVLMVMPIGCHGPGSAVSGVAEGLVNGKRQTVPLTLTPCGGDRYMLKRQWPASGSWALVFTAKKNVGDSGKTQTIHADSIVRLDRQGQVCLVSAPRSYDWKDAKVLSDGKTKLMPWTFEGGDKVVQMDMVSGDLKTAVAHVLKSSSAGSTR